MKLVVNIDGKMKTVNVSEDDVHVGMNSGVPFSSQYVFLDYDKMSIENIKSIAEEILKEESLRKILLVQGSRKTSFHIVSFSVVKYDKLIEIMSKYHSDPAHIAKTQDNGYATIRVTAKNRKKPKIIAEYWNKLPEVHLSFYDFDAEKAYKELLKC